MKKRYYFIFIALIVYFVVFFIMSGKSEEYKTKDKKMTLIVGNDTVFQLEKNKWNQITSPETLNALNWQDFSIILNNKNIGKYKVVKSDRLYLFDKDNNAYKYDGNIIAYQANYTFKVKDFKSDVITDFSTVRKVLKKNNLPIDPDYYTSNIINVDIDNDNKMEKIYIISNAFSSLNNNSEAFSIIFLEKNDTIHQIFNLTGEKAIMNKCSPYVKSIIDTNNDGKYEILIGCGGYSNMEPIYELYRFKENRFEKLATNH